MLGVALFCGCVQAGAGGDGDEMRGVAGSGALADSSVVAMPVASPEPVPVPVAATPDAVTPGVLPGSDALEPGAPARVWSAAEPHVAWSVEGEGGALQVWDEPAYWRPPVIAAATGGDVFLATTAGSELHWAAPERYALLQRLDERGEARWQRRAQAADVHALSALPDGGVVTGGHRGPSDCQAVERPSCSSGLITRFDADGEELWSLTLRGSVGATGVTAVAFDGELLYVAGVYGGSLGFEGLEDLRSVGGLDHFVAALDPADGAARWAFGEGAPGDDGDGPLLVARPEGGVVLAAHYFGGPEDLSPVVIDYDALGRERFRRELVGPDSRDARVHVYRHALDSEGRVWVAVGLRGEIDLGGELGTRVASDQGEWDALVLVLDADGVPRTAVQLVTETDGGYRVSGLVPDGPGALVLGDYGMRSLGRDTAQMVAELHRVSADGELERLERFPLDYAYRRQAATRTDDGRLLWTGMMGFDSSTLGLLDEPITEPQHAFLRTWSSLGDGERAER